MKLQKLPSRLTIPRMLFPELTLTPEGGFWDKWGIDGYIGDKSVQCKHDTRIAKSGNLWHEIYEKSALNDSQKWRKAGGKVDFYLFTTESPVSYTGYLIDVDILAQYENGKPLKTIYPNGGAATSMGYLIPLTELIGNYIKRSKQVLNI